MIGARARRLAAVAVGDLLDAWARDITELSAKRSCLVVAPHADDETLGCGAAIARKVDAGRAVGILVLSDGATWPPGQEPATNRRIRQKELYKAAQALGLSRSAVRQHSFPESQLKTVAVELGDAIADAVRELRPEEVYTTATGDPHPDHAAVGHAAQQVLRGSDVMLFAYPVWQWENPVSWLTVLGRGARRPLSVSTVGYLERKREALMEYRSQVSLDREEVPHTIGPGLLSHFLGRRELLFPLAPGLGRS